MALKKIEAKDNPSAETKSPPWIAKLGTTTPSAVFFSNISAHADGERRGACIDSGRCSRGRVSPRGLFFFSTPTDRWSVVAARSFAGRHAPKCL